MERERGSFALALRETLCTLPSLALAFLSSPPACVDTPLRLERDGYNKQIVGKSMNVETGKNQTRKRGEEGNTQTEKKRKEGEVTDTVFGARRATIITLKMCNRNCVRHL